MWKDRMLYGFGIAYLLVILVAVYLISTPGCAASPYAKCSQPGVQRCTGATVEQCVGGNWQPIRNCGSLAFEGEPVDGTCAMHGSKGMCEVVR